MRFYFVPESFVISDELRQWTLDLGYTESDIKNEEEKWRDHQYKRPMMDPVRCWRNWARNAIKYGHVTPTVKREYRGLEQVSEEQRKADEAKAWAEMNRLRGVK